MLKRASNFQTLGITNQKIARIMRLPQLVDQSARLIAVMGLPNGHAQAVFLT
jgi:hypothetical protein